MQRDTPNVITVRLVSVYSFQSIIIKDSDLHVIWSSNNPVLPWHKLGCSHWQVAHFEGLDQCLTFVIPDIDVALIQWAKHPWFRRVEIDTFYSVGPCGQLAFDIQTQWLKESTIFINLLKVHLIIPRGVTFSQTYSQSRLKRTKSMKQIRTLQGNKTKYK